jgi:hypothetical protein
MNFNKVERLHQQAQMNGNNINELRSQIRMNGGISNMDEGWIMSRIAEIQGMNLQIQKTLKEQIQVNNF